MYKLFEIKNSNIHGKGVFSLVDIPIGTKLTCDVMIIDKKNKTFDEYHYPWLSPKYDSICMGFGNYFNHSIEPNVKILSIDKINLTKTFVTIKKISKNEELFLKYM